MQEKEWVNPEQVEKNISVSRSELQEMRKHMNGKSGVLVQHSEPNRKDRRAKEDLRPIHNNRAKTSARTGNKLFIKMSRFYMSLRNKQLKLS